MEPASRRLEPVEVFRGVPYGARPPRLGPPPPPDPWPGTRLADTFPPVCPQRYPDISNKYVTKHTYIFNFLPMVESTLRTNKRVLLRYPKSYFLYFHHHSNNAVVFLLGSENTLFYICDFNLSYLP